MASGGGLGDADLQRLATVQSGMGLTPHLMRMSSVPVKFDEPDVRSMEVRQIESTQQTPWMLYGAYAAAGLAVLGLGYVAFSGKKKGKV